jgi:hypothetical protein
MVSELQGGVLAHAYAAAADAASLGFAPYIAQGGTCRQALPAIAIAQHSTARLMQGTSTTKSPVRLHHLHAVLSACGCHLSSWEPRSWKCRRAASDLRQ